MEQDILKACDDCFKAASARALALGAVFINQNLQVELEAINAVEALLTQSIEAQPFDLPGIEYAIDKARYLRDLLTIKELTEYAYSTGVVIELMRDGLGPLKAEYLANRKAVAHG